MSVSQIKNGLSESPGRLIVILTAVLLLPFSFKAIHIDDPLFISTADRSEALPKGGPEGEKMTASRKEAE